MASCCSTGSSLFGVLAIAGLLGIGVAGYQYLTPAATTTATAVNHTDDHGSCALCPSGSEAKVTLASESKTECSAAMACSEAKGTCSEAMAACHGEKTCSEGEKVNAINAANVEKADACTGEKCDKGDACCKLTGKSECTEKPAGCCSGEKKSESTTPAPASGGGF